MCQHLIEFNKSSLLEHVAKNPERVFIVIHDHVYDVTPFLNEVKFFFI